MDDLRAFLDKRALAGWGESEPSVAELPFAQDVNGLRVTLVGVGDGALALLLLEKGAKLTLVELSPVAMARVREQIEKAEYPGRVAGYIMADARDITRLPEGRQDIVVMPGRVLNYLVVEDRAAACRQLARLLKAGGAAYIGASAQKSQDAPIAAALTAPMLRMLALGAGLKVERLYEGPDDSLFLFAKKPEV